MSNEKEDEIKVDIYDEAERLGDEVGAKSEVDDEVVDSLAFSIEILFEVVDEEGEEIFSLEVEN